MKPTIFYLVTLAFAFLISLNRLEAAETKENGDSNLNEINRRKITQLKYSLDSAESEEDEYPNEHFSNETPKEISAYMNDMERRSLKKGFNAWAGRSIDETEPENRLYIRRQLNNLKRFVHLPYKNLNFLKQRERRRPWGGAPAQFA